MANRSANMQYEPMGILPTDMTTITGQPLPPPPAPEVDPNRMVTVRRGKVSKKIPYEQWVQEQMAIARSPESNIRSRNGAFGTPQSNAIKALEAEGISLNPYAGFSGGIAGEGGSGGGFAPSKSGQVGFEQARSDIETGYGKAQDLFRPMLGIGGGVQSMGQKIQAGLYDRGAVRDPSGFTQGQGPNLGQFRFQNAPQYQGYQTPGLERFNYNPESDPNYRFARDEGVEAVQRSLAARGLTGSGAEMKEIARYTAGLAGQHAAQNRGQALQEYQAEQAQRMNLAGMGQRGLEFTQGLREQGRQFDTSQRYGAFSDRQRLGEQARQFGAQQAQRGYEFDTGQQFNVDQARNQLLQDKYNRDQWLAQMDMGARDRIAGLETGSAGLYADLAIGSSEAKAAKDAARAARNSNTLGGLMQLGGALGTAAIMASDVRLKKNIKPTGKKKNGFNLWEFEYKNGNGQRYEGVMAQEVEFKNPEAVSVMGNGYKGVHYDKIGVELKEVA